VAFNVTLYSFTKEVNSTARPSGSGSTYPCVVITPCDIINPQLRLQLGTGYNPSSYNYCYVPAWGRYYWVNDWIMDGPIWTAVCNVDPLASWKTQIGATSAYVLRSAAAYDGDVIDNLYPTLADPTVTVSNYNTGWFTDLDYDHGTFVVGLINSQGATDYVYMTPTQFRQFATEAFSDRFYTQAAAGVSWMTKAIFDPMQYLASATWFPLLFTGGTATTAKLGYWDTGVSCYQAATFLNRTASQLPVPKHPQTTARGAWINSAPVTTYTLETWPFGRLALDPALLYGYTTISLVMTVDYISGVGILKVIAGNSTTGPIITTSSAQLGVSVQISQVLRDNFGATMGVASGLIGGVISAATGNVAGAIGGAMSAISSGVKGMYPDVTTSGANAGFAGLYGQWRLYSKFYLMVDEDLAHRGRPLCAVRRLDTMPGYQLCTDTDLQLPCTRTEMDAIRGYLESGYYFE